ncbi:MAG TPA: mucoidy inhibitor MuiA family protein [Crocinitomix sp.]|nr:mucoidy inhibitor MuiA family protein [Crocinitomix sp.]
MKTLILFLFFIGLSIYAKAEDNKYVVKSKITKVTVYQQGAQVKRRANYSISKGINKIILTGISKHIDPNSIQVSSTGNVVLLDSKFSSYYPSMSEQEVNTIPPKIQYRINQLKDSIFEMSFDITAVQNKIDVLKSEKRILNNTGAVKGIGKVNDSIPLLKEALVFYHKKMNQINNDLLKLNRKKMLLKRQEKRMNDRLDYLYNYSNSNQFEIDKKYKPVHQIEITLLAKEATNGRIYVNYLVSEAGWIPQYDIRNKTSDNSIKLTYKAQVFQNTGVEWKDIRLSLSTNNPYANKTKPELTTWYLNYSAYYEGNLNRARTIQYKKMRSTNASAYSAKAPVTDNTSTSNTNEYNQETSEDFTQMIQNILSVEYAIDLSYSIKSNNEKYMVLINSKTLDTKYRYYAVPKIDLSCYLIAQITNLDDLELVPGQANIFHNSAYLGTTFLNPSIMNDTMNLSLGKDPKLLVKRTTLKNESKEKVVGDKIIKTFAYYIEIKNHKNSTVKITLQDQIPISQNKEIEIELINGSKGQLNKVTGLMEWNLKLKPKEFKKINLSYSITYDKTQQIQLVSN